MTLPDLLQGLDPAKLRSSPARMRAGLLAVVSAGADVWNGPLEGLVETLGQLARVDMCLARLVEGHADAVRICEQAPARRLDGVYGVWASRSVGTGLRAGPTEAGWRLHGELRFASGVGLVDRALASAWLDEDRHVLLDIDANGVTADESSWTTWAMDASRSFTVDVDVDVDSGSQVGGLDFYLSRPGFAVGGLAVAAVWAGGARHVVDAVTTSVREFSVSPHQQRRVGVMEQAVWTADVAVASTLRVLAAAPPDDVPAEIGRARTAVVLACDAVLSQAPLVVGPGGLSRDARLARVLADLAVYIRQHHLDDELTRLGATAIESHELIGG